MLACGWPGVGGWLNVAVGVRLRVCWEGGAWVPGARRPAVRLPTRMHAPPCHPPARPPTHPPPPPQISTDEAAFRRERTLLSKLNLVLVDILKQVRGAGGGWGGGSACGAGGHTQAGGGGSGWVGGWVCVWVCASVCGGGVRGGGGVVVLRVHPRSSRPPAHPPPSLPRIGPTAGPPSSPTSWGPHAPLRVCARTQWPSCVFCQRRCSTFQRTTSHRWVGVEGGGWVGAGACRRQVQPRGRLAACIRHHSHAPPPPPPACSPPPATGQDQGAEELF